MIKTQNIILKIYAINFLIYVCHKIPNKYIVQKQPSVVFFRTATYNTGVFPLTFEIF